MAGLAQGAYVRGAMKGSGCIVGAQITAATGLTGQIRTSVQGVNYEATTSALLESQWWRFAHGLHHVDLQII